MYIRLLNRRRNAVSSSHGQFVAHSTKRCFLGSSVADAEEDDLLTGICRSNESSFLPPAINLDNLDGQGEIICPDGSSLIQGK